MPRLLSTEGAQKFNDDDGYVIRQRFFSKEAIDKLYV